MNNFFTSYDTALEEKSNNKQAALSSIESKYTSSFVGKTNYIDLNGLFALMVDKKEVNERVKLNNGYLTDELNTEYLPMISAINNLTNLKEYLDIYEIPFAYVQTPHLIPSDDDPMIPLGYETHVNGNSDRLLTGLSENGVDYLDLRENIRFDEPSNYEIYFSTDHHWTIETAFLAHEHVGRFIDGKLNENISNSEYFNLENYYTETYTNIFSGSHANRTGIFFAGVDDISIITPKFETNFSVQIPNHNWNRTGNFETAFLEKKYLENSSIANFNKDTYCVYLDSNTEYVKIVNNQALNDKKILLIKHSFSQPMATFLALHYKEVHLYQQGTQEELLKILHEIQPDIVLQVATTNDSLTAEAKVELETSRSSN